MALDLEQVVVDWAIVGGDKSHAEVVASIAPRAEVSELIETLRAGGCEPRVLEAEGFVLGNLTAAFDLPGTRLLVDLGHRKTTFCLLVDGKAMAARSVPVAGAALTEAVGKDPFVHSALLLSATSTISLATGIASIYARDAMAMKQAQVTLTEAFPGRFLLGLGVSHAPMVGRPNVMTPVFIKSWPG